MGWRTIPFDVPDETAPADQLVEHGVIWAADVWCHYRTDFNNEPGFFPPDLYGDVEFWFVNPTDRSPRTHESVSVVTSRQNLNLEGGSHRIASYDTAGTLLTDDEPGHFADTWQIGEVGAGLPIHRVRIYNPSASPYPQWYDTYSFYQFPGLRVWEPDTGRFIRPCRRFPRDD